MNEHETRLVRALDDEAASRDVDAQAVLARTRDRLLRAEVPRRRRVAPALAAAATVALVGGAAAAVTLNGAASPDGVTASASEVDREFSCPDRVEIDVSGAQDEFLPRLGGRTPAQVAEEYDAPRWTFVEDGDSARLFLGNEDGSLGSVAGYDRTGDDWVLREATACGNGSPAAPTAEGLRLGRHGVAPHPAENVLDVGAPDVEPVLVDDRQVYDHSGLVLRHRSLYAAPCGQRLCFGVGQPDSGVHETVRVSGAPTYTTFEMCSFFVPDDLVGRPSPYRLVGVWDPTGDATGMGAVSVEGTTLAEMMLKPALESLGDTYEASPFQHPSWGDGRLWLALVPARDGHGLIASLHDDTGRLSFRSASTRCD